jgi:hypothetical protein
MEETKAGTDPEVISDYQTDVLWLEAKLPAPKPHQLFHTELIREHLATSSAHFPLIGSKFSSEDMAPFWRWFNGLLNSNECGATFSFVKQAAKDEENGLTALLAQQFSVTKGLGDKADALSKKLAPFLALNLALGFKRIIYIPFRTIEPWEGGTPMVRSGAGVVLCLNNGVELTRQTLSFLFENPDRKATPATARAELVPLVVALKTLVDVATSRASIGDWKYYHRVYERASLQHAHAKTMWAGYEHEVRNLQLTVGLAVPEEMQSDAILMDLAANLSISKLASDAHINRDGLVPLGELVADLREILTWTDREPDYSKCDKFLECEVPQPLRFVLAELCRNAHNHSQELPGEIEMEVGVKKAGSVRALVSNVTRNGDRSFIARPNRNSTRFDEGFGGHDLIKSVVCGLLKGTFIFKIAQGLATATVLLPPRKTEMK